MANDFFRVLPEADVRGLGQVPTRTGQGLTVIGKGLENLGELAAGMMRQHQIGKFEQGLQDIYTKQEEYEKRVTELQGNIDPADVESLRTFATEMEKLHSGKVEGILSPDIAEAQARSLLLDASRRTPHNVTEYTRLARSYGFGGGSADTEAASGMASSANSISKWYQDMNSGALKSGMSVSDYITYQITINNANQTVARIKAQTDFNIAVSGDDYMNAATQVAATSIIPILAKMGNELKTAQSQDPAAWENWKLNMGSNFAATEIQIREQIRLGAQQFGLNTSTAEGKAYLETVTENALRPLVAFKELFNSAKDPGALLKETNAYTEQLGVQATLNVLRNVDPTLTALDPNQRSAIVTDLFRVSSAFDAEIANNPALVAKLIQDKQLSSEDIAQLPALSSIFIGYGLGTPAQGNAFGTGEEGAKLRAVMTRLLTTGLIPHVQRALTNKTGVLSRERSYFDTLADHTAGLYALEQNTPEATTPSVSVNKVPTTAADKNALTFKDILAMNSIENNTIGQDFLRLNTRKMDTIAKQIASLAKTNPEELKGIQRQYDSWIVNEGNKISFENFGFTNVGEDFTSNDIKRFKTGLYLSGNTLYSWDSDSKRLKQATLPEFKFEVSENFINQFFKGTTSGLKRLSDGQVVPLPFVKVPEEYMVKVMLTSNPSGGEPRFTTTSGMGAMADVIRPTLQSAEFAGKRNRQGRLLPIEEQGFYSTPFDKTRFTMENMNMYIYQKMMIYKRLGQEEEGKAWLQSLIQDLNSKQ